MAETPSSSSSFSISSSTLLKRNKETKEKKERKRRDENATKELEMAERLLMERYTKATMVFGALFGMSVGLGCEMYRNRMQTVDGSISLGSSSANSPLVEHSGDDNIIATVSMFMATALRFPENFNVYIPLAWAVLSVKFWFHS